MMNIGQIARNQQMLYKIASRNSNYSSKPSTLLPPNLSAESGVQNGWNLGSSAGDNGDNFFSSPDALKGTVRQIAKRLYDASFSSDATAEKNGAGFTQGGYTVGGDQTLQAIRKQLGTKVESQQQLYQPDQTMLSGNFAQLQALAESAVNRSRTVSLSSETTKKIQDLALSDAKNSVKGETANTSAISQKDRFDMVQEEVQKYAPSKRAAAFNTINKVWQSEIDRIGEYIKEKDSNWTAWGDEFDTSILNDYKPGINMWI